MKTKMPIVTIAASMWLMLIMVSSPANAQLLGHNLTGDFGLTSGTQPDPGTYLSFLYYGYRGDTLRDGDGNAVRQGSLDANGYGIGLWHVVNWLQTIPGRSWHVLWRIYGPTQVWYDQKWKISEIELVE